MDNINIHFKSLDFYVSPEGNDLWSGKHPDAVGKGNDGPFATIGRARNAIRELKDAGKLFYPINVWLREGTYTITQPITFTYIDSAPVTYAAYPGEHPVISGGKKLDGWEVEKIRGIDIWTKYIPEVEQGKWYFRELFVNGERRSRPRFPKTGYFWMEDVPDITVNAGPFEGSYRFQCKEGDIDNWKGLKNAEVIVHHYWVEERMPVLSYDEKNRIITSRRKSAFSLKDDFNTKWAKYYMDNLEEALSDPGEWFLDKLTGKLYYIPLPGEEPGKAEVIAPIAVQLIDIKGDARENKFVDFIGFRGITFAHTDWFQPKGGGDKLPHLNIDLNIDYATVPQAAYNVPGVIKLEGARNCFIEDCRIEHIGWYGIEMAESCCNIRITGNEIRDMGAGGIKQCGGDANNPQYTRTGKNTITDNHIHHGGYVFASAVGILSMHSYDNEISHNHIHHLFYSGISCGWIWGYAENISKNNRIYKNHIHHLGGGGLSDMGGIYTLGIQPGTEISGNLIHDIEKCNYGGWAIYCDEGSSYIVIEKNLCYRTNSQILCLGKGRERIVRNNIFAFGAEGIIVFGFSDPRNGATIERNIFVTDDTPVLVGGSNGLLEDKRFVSDLNILWNISGKEVFHANQDVYENETFLRTSLFNMSDIRALGYEVYSIIDNPKLENILQDRFALAEDSPAIKNGFVPISFEDVGARTVGKEGL